MIIYIILIILGFILLIKGSDMLVEGASNLAKKFNIPELVIGITVVAIGTSMPELVVSATASISGHSDLSIGNVLGSNMSNLFLILGSCAIIKSLVFKKETKFVEIPFTIFCTVLLFNFANNGISYLITAKEGVLLLVFCFLFIMYNLIMLKKVKENYSELIEIKTKTIEEISVIKSIISIVVGVVALKFGGDYVVKNASAVASVLGITEKMISLTIVAFSTSLPELITSITATKKGDVDIAIGNILGSQIFNILLIIGVSSVLNPISFSIKYNKELIILCIGTVMIGIFPFLKNKNEMNKIEGFIFLSIYVLYMISLVILER